MENVLLYLTMIAVVLLIGLLISILSSKLKISNMLLLIIVGIIAGSITYKGSSLFQFPPVFIVSIATLALVMIVFDGSSRMKLKDLGEMSYRALEVTGLYMVLSLIIVGAITLFLFFSESITSNSIILSLIFAFLMIGTDPASIFVMFKDKTNKLLEFLKVEAIINTPVVVLFPFILIELVKGTTTISLLSQIGPFLQQIVTGIGTGIVVGLIIFKVMKKTYSQEYSPIAILTATLITYAIAEQLNGNGILAVATLGLLFGNTYVKNKFLLTEFSSTLSTSLEILVFVLIGTVTKLPWSDVFFFAKALIIFAILLVCRYFALHITFKEKYDKRQLIFMTLNMSKGIAVATAILTISFVVTPGMTTLVNLTLVTIIYSLITSTLATLIGKDSLKFEEEKEAEETK